MLKRDAFRNVKLFSNKQKPRLRSRASPCQIAALRLNDLARLFRARYGVTLPNDDAGRDDMAVALNHIASLAHPRGRMLKWMEVWAPWVTAGEQSKLIADAITAQQHWTADQLAWRMRLTFEDRTALGLTTIGAIDMPKRERTKRRKRLHKARMAKLRGYKVPELAVSELKPWIEQGISRRTWYRRMAQQRVALNPCAP
jgi:hypothetical protein